MPFSNHIGEVNWFSTLHNLLNTSDLEHDRGVDPCGVTSPKVQPIYTSSRNTSCFELCPGFRHSHVPLQNPFPIVTKVQISHLFHSSL